MKKSNTRFKSMVLLLGLMLVACGGSDDPDPDPDPGSGDAAGSVTISIDGFAFSEPDTLARGGTATVTNNDSTTHTWTANDGLFDSSGISPGESFEFTFDDAGAYTYFCNIHPTMTGSITVSG
ncbi:MAG: plastocyanin/azurin family copper-binding protein [Acidimicrobiia bacterium]